MTVQTLLGSMSQQELCHWIAYHRIENSRYEEQSGKSAEVKKDEDTKKEEAMVSQLLALAGKSPQKTSS